MNTDYQTEASKCRAWTEIDHEALRANYRAVKRAMPEKTMVMAVVKADAYGHGAVSVARSLDADFYGVACLDEAIELREAGIAKPILILGYTQPALSGQIAEYGVYPAIFDFESASALAGAAAAAGKEAGCFIALDTGMNRIGYRYSPESIAEIKRISGLKGLRIAGMFTHFFSSDSADKTAAKEQYRLFCAFDRDLKTAGVVIPIRSIYNSPAILDFPPDGGFELVREGIFLYGLRTTDGGNLNHIESSPVLSFYSRVTYVKQIQPGEGVSYGHTFKADSPRAIATVSAGYADGVPRLLSNRGRVIVNGRYAPIVGRVCMDQFMIDVTGLPAVKRGDRVTIIGRDGGCEITADDIADLCGTIGYEIVCGLVRPRLPRIDVGL